MPNNLDDVFKAVQSQGKSPSRDNPKSPTDAYFAYLDKADWDPSDSVWYLMFDMIPAEAALLGLAGDTGDTMPPPILPTIIFHATQVSKAAVYEALQLGSDDEPAEGSWYAVWLQEGGDPKTQVVGDLYHPDTDFVPNSPTYGQWYIGAADLIALPIPPKRDALLGPPGTPRGPRATPKAVPRTYGPIRKFGITKPRRYRPHKKLITLVLRNIPPPPPPPPPGHGALGVMAIGQGGFNLVFARGTLEPVFYYDAGYPLGFFHATVPPPMDVNLVGAGYAGPIMQNAAINLYVILSHFDWDHWRFGAYVDANGASLGQLNWTVPVAPMGGTAAAWLANVNAAGIPAFAPPQAGANGLVIYKLQPGGGPPAFIINNSGLAVRVPVDIAGVPAAGVLLTGDGNFNLLPGPALAGLHVIGAVHHGSNNHGAAANQPAAPGGTTGRIAYSYGINPANGNHAYHFPDPNAVAAYQGANWGPPTEQATAEGANINVGPSAPGNIRIGDQNNLPAGYNATAFFAIGYALP